MDEKPIIIVFLPLNNEDTERIFATAIKDQKLIDRINEKKEELKENKIEVFNQVHNIIVTEKGFYAAFYKKETP